MLAAAGEVVYVNEPLNPQHPPGRSPGVLNAEVSHRYQYICADNEERWARAFADTLRLRYRLIPELRRNRGPYDIARLVKYFTAFTAGRLRRRRALIDDPFAVMSSVWFAERLGCDVVVCVRHPVAFAASRKRLGWTVDFRELLDQPLLLRDLLGRYTGEMQALVGSQDRIANSALLWRMTYGALAELARERPELRLRRYEDLASQPATGFRELYQLCGLAWTDHAQKRILAATTGGRSPDRSHVWSLRGGLSRTAFRSMDSRAALRAYRDRLTAEEIAQVRELTGDVATLYYGESEGFG